MPADVWSLEGYQLTGPAEIRYLGRNWEHPVRVSQFVARSLCVGGWLRFLRKIDDPGAWYVTSYKTKADASAAMPEAG